MSRIIINNHTQATDERVLDLVLSVVKQGRLSANGTVYCYCTTIQNKTVEESFMICAKRTKAESDVFEIYPHHPHKEGEQ